MVKRFFLIFFLGGIVRMADAQPVDSIYFHLYTDSLKKGFYNYINVDGKSSDGSWMPLTDKDIRFSSNAGTFRGNDLFIDSSYTGESVTVKAVLKNNPAVWKEITIYIRKRPFGPLPTEKEILDELQHESKKGRQHIG